MSAYGDACRLLRTLQSQVALVLPLVEVAHGRGRQQVGKWAVRWSDVKRGNLIRQQRQVRVGPKKRGNLLRLRFIDIQLVRQQGGIVLLEAIFHILPGQVSDDLRYRWLNWLLCRHN